MVYGPPLVQQPNICKGLADLRGFVFLARGRNWRPATNFIQNEVKQPHYQTNVKYNQITINKGQQAQDEQDWNRKWTDMRKQIEDNKNKIQHSNSTTTTTRVPDRDAERTVQEEEEEDQTDNKVVGYFQNILQELKTKKQN